MNRAIDNIMLTNLLDLQITDCTIVEYVWIGGTGKDLRSKAKTYHCKIDSIDQLSEWNYDGSSTFQATTDNSEITLKPVSLFRDPFRKDPHKICLCETFTSDGKPTNTNFRYYANKIFNNENINLFQPWFGLEQEYILVQKYLDGKAWPYCWPKDEYPRPQGPYYCSVGAENSYGRDIVNLHYKLCLYAGVKLYGINAEVMPSQWEFQIGTCVGIDAADHLWMARYILYRVGEYFNVDINLDAKFIKGDWNGSGCHTNFSTIQMREDGGLDVIKSSLDNLSKNHSRSIMFYGEKNHERLNGKHETSSIESFSYGTANRGSSVRIPKVTEIEGRGYFEDRRPASNIDPYLVTSSLFAFSCLDGGVVKEMEEHFEKFIKNKQ
jgi:glutamine synthetase